MLCCKKTDVNRDKLLIVEVEYRAGTLAQWVKVLFINPHNQSSNLGSSIVKGKNRALKVVLCPRVYTVANSCLPTCSKWISKCTIKVKLKLKNKTCMPPGHRWRGSQCSWPHPLLYPHLQGTVSTGMHAWTIDSCAATWTGAATQTGA